MAKRLARIAGWLLAAASLVFIVMVARDRAGEIAAIRLSGMQWAGVAALAGAYGLGLFLLAGGWHCLLRFVAAAPHDPRVSIHAYASSQLAKYVPGNVFHLVGRHMMLRAHGLPDARLALASLVEIALMAASAGLVVLSAVAIEPPARLAAWLGPGTDWLAAAPLAALAAMGFAVSLAGKLVHGAPRWLAAALALHLLFFLVMAAIIAALAAMLAEVSPWLVAGGGVAAWLAGFVTPGAPSGLGVREAAMVIFAGDQVPAGALLVLAALFRVVTLAGDVVTFVLGRVLFGGR